MKKVPLNEDSINRNKDLIKEADVVKEQFFALKAKVKPKGFKTEEDKEKAEEKKKEEEKKE